MKASTCLWNRLLELQEMWLFIFEHYVVLYKHSFIDYIFVVSGKAV